MDIYPSILQKSASDVLHFVSLAEHVFDHIQIDIADNSYTHTQTCSVSDLADVCEETSFHPRMTAEMHLMVENIAFHIDQLHRLNTYLPIREVFVHLEPAVRWTQGHPEALNQLLHAHFPYSFGIVVSPEVIIREHAHALLPFETIQIMTVNPGAQGSEFLPDQLEKISQLRSLGYNGRIVLDGGISEKTLPTILDNSFWPDSVCPGSYFASRQDNLHEAAQELYEAISRAEDEKISRLHRTTIEQSES